MSDDKLVFDMKSLQKANKELGKGGFLGREGDIGKPAGSEQFVCFECGQLLPLANRCQNDWSYCVDCCFCQPICIKESAE